MTITIEEDKRFNIPEADHECYLMDDGTLDTVIEIDGMEHRFSTEFASSYRDSNGSLSGSGFTALCKMAIEEDERHWK